MTTLLVLDDQPYTLDPFVKVAEGLKFDVVKETSIVPFKQTVEHWAAEGRHFASAIDMNLRNVTPLDIDELGSSEEEIGNGEAAGLVVLRHLFMIGDAEPLHNVLSQVPIALISADEPAARARREIEQLHRARAADISFVPKPDSSATPIPKWTSWEEFLKRVIAAEAKDANGMSAEEAIFLDVTKFLKLNEVEAARMLGFTNGPINIKTLVAAGTSPTSRDWRDRLHHLYQTLDVLLSVYNKRADARKWLTAPLEILDGKSPRDLIVGGDMVDLLVVKQFVFEIGYAS